MRFYRIILLPFLFIILSATTVENSDIVIKILNIRNQNGNILISMYNNSEQFPDHPKWKYLIPKTELSAQGNQFQIKGVLSGKYAIAIIDDENCDTLLQKNFLGMPKEGYGFSNNIKPSISGAPSFDDCTFTVSGGKNKIVEIELQYLFKERDNQANPE
jgi:uncharacterized protein (DUF2141 family)